MAFKFDTWVERGLYLSAIFRDANDKDRTGHIMLPEYTLEKGIRGIFKAYNAGEPLPKTYQGVPLGEVVNALVALEDKKKEIMERAQRESNSHPDRSLITQIGRVMARILSL